MPLSREVKLRIAGATAAAVMVGIGIFRPEVHMDKTRYSIAFSGWTNGRVGKLNSQFGADVEIYPKSWDVGVWKARDFLPGEQNSDPIMTRVTDYWFARLSSGKPLDLVHIQKK